MRSATRRYARVLCASLALLVLLSWQAVPAGAAPDRHGAAALPARLIRIYGYLEKMDATSSGDIVLHIYSKAHHTWHQVIMTPNTVVKEHGKTVPRATLNTHPPQYVIVSCTRRSDGTLEAVRVTIVIRHRRQKRH